MNPIRSINRRFLLNGLLLVAVLAVVWWLADSDAPVEQKPDVQGARQLDYYLRDAQATAMGLDGKPLRTLYSSRVEHFLDDDTSELAAPLLTIHQGQEPPWEIRSESGRVSADGELIFLAGEVKITRKAAEGIRPIELDTQNVRIQPQQDYAETDEKVRVRSYDDWLNATGMRAWFRQPAKIKLLNDVTSFYAPPS